MTPAKPSSEGQCATLADVVSVERICIARGRVVIAILRLADGRRATWHFVLGAAPGQPQHLHVVPEA